MIITLCGSGSGGRRGKRNTTVPEKEDKAEAKKVKLYESGLRLGKTFNKTLVLNFSISQQTSNWVYSKARSIVEEEKTITIPWKHIGKKFKKSCQEITCQSLIKPKNPISKHGEQQVGNNYQLLLVVVVLLHAVAFSTRKSLNCYRKYRRKKLEILWHSKSRTF